MSITKSATMKRVGAVLFAAGLALSAPAATANAQPSLPDATGSLDTPPPDMTRLPVWAFEALHYGPVSAAELQACRDAQGDVIILIYPGPCPNEPIDELTYHAAKVLWFFTAGTGSLSS